MIRQIVHIALFCLPFVAVSQDSSKVRKWTEEKDDLHYQKSQGYKGPTDWYGSSPADMLEYDEDDYHGGGYGSGSYGSGSSGIPYSPQQIQRDRSRNGGLGGGSGNLRFDPEIQPPDPIDVNPPDVDTPDLDLDVNAPRVPLSFWKILLFIILSVLAMLIIYLIVKNSSQSNKKVMVDVEDHWNPGIVTKTELELRLEEAIKRGDYRECVRIYFTFILKELITKSWIVWKKEKTNDHYLLEMRSKPNSGVFAECIRIYDLVWYGEYDIDKENYNQLKPTLEQYYKSLNPKDE